jgi:hypothetical protein
MKEKGVAAATNPSLSAWAGPWGVSFAMNLTPDKETGIAEWSEQMFIQVARTGKHQGQPNGRDILPPMPWFNLKDLKDSDLKAMWAYLRSIPPVRNNVPLPLLPSVSVRERQLTMPGPARIDRAGFAANAAQFYQRKLCAFSQLTQFSPADRFRHR